MDVGRLLGLTGPGAWLLAALFWATNITLVIFSGGPPMRTVEGWIALLLVLGAAVLVVVPSGFPLPLPIVLAVLGVVAFSTVAIDWNLVPYGWPGYTSWHFGANTFVLFMVALRGRVAWGASGMVMMSLITIHWTWATTGDAWHGFDLTYRQIATYFAGAFFAFWLRRTARQIVQFQEAERRRIADEQGLSAAADERRLQLERVRRLAGPALVRIAAGETTPDDRVEHRLLEAELRDQIRGRALAVDPLPEALRAARARGVEAALLDDLRDDAPSPEYVATAAAWAAERLGTVTSGDATIRLAHVDGMPVVTFATSDGSAQTFSP